MERGASKNKTISSAEKKQDSTNSANQNNCSATANNQKWENGKVNRKKKRSRR